MEAGALSSATDRLGLQNDAFALARAGYLDATQALALASTYRNEKDFAVWSDLCENVQAYDMLLCGQLGHESFRAFARGLFDTIFASVGWDAQPTDSHLTMLLRAKVIEALARYGDRKVIAEAMHRFDEGSPVAADLRAAVYAAVVTERGADGYESVLRLYRETGTRYDKAVAGMASPAISSTTLNKGKEVICRYYYRLRFSP